MDVYFHGIDNDHGCKLFLVKPAQHESLFQDWTFGGFDFVLFPAGLKQIIGGDLKRVLKQGVELLQIAFVKLTHSKVAVNLKINMFFVFVFHKDHLS